MNVATGLYLRIYLLKGSPEGFPTPEWAGVSSPAAPRRLPRSRFLVWGWIARMIYIPIGINVPNRNIYIYVSF